MIDIYIVLAVGFLLILGRYFLPKPVPLPPGPKGLPLIGNMLDMPTTQAWKVFAQWSEKWGDIISVNVLGQPMIIIQSSRIAFDLLDKRSAIYSDRPVLMMGGELVGWKNSLALTPNGKRFREYRKFISRIMGSRGTTKQHYPLGERETHRFLARILAQPNQLAAEIRRTAGAIILMITHGYQVQENNDPIVRVVDEATEQFSLSTEPGAFLVDVVPALRYIPEWFPGARWKRTAAQWAKTLSDMADIPHEFVKQQMAAGTALPSLTSELLGDKQVDPDTEFNIKWSAASLYSGGADTTVSAINSFFLAMSLYPEVQKKAQAEIDAVVGTDRLPTFSDREHLPFVEAVVQEVLRWNPVTPLGVPHRVTEDDIYQGYSIPKGSIVIANIWKMIHDPEVYSNPLEFNPDRFMGPKPERDPRDICFGFGRRICPGLNLADASVFISCAMSLAVFNISKGLDDSGREIEPVVEYCDGTISHPKPFQCRIKPRSDKSAALIHAVNA